MEDGVLIGLALLAFLGMCVWALRTWRKSDASSSSDRRTRALENLEAARTRVQKKHGGPVLSAEEIADLQMRASITADAEKDPRKAAASLKKIME